MTLEPIGSECAVEIEFEPRNEFALAVSGDPEVWMLPINITSHPQQFFGKIHNSGTMEGKVSSRLVDQYFLNALGSIN